MTHLNLYEYALIEQNKHEAPTLLIEEYNYIINKAIIQYTNLTYARFDLNQQSSDDLRWLQRSAKLPILEESNIIHPGESKKWYCNLPFGSNDSDDSSEERYVDGDYLHMLNCTVEFDPVDDDKTKKKCPSPEEQSTGHIYSLCRRLTANQNPAIIQNAYLKPSYKRPYFYINNESKSDVQKTMEIRCGDTSLYTPKFAYIDYLKTPEKIELTWDQVNGVGDTSPECEFPDAVAYEIINIFVKLLFENASDPRLQTHFAINQTVGGMPQAEKK